MGITWNIPNRSVFARVQRIGNKQGKYFSVAEYGTREKAEEEAKKWLAERTTNLPEKITLKDRKTRRNTSGVVGVRLALSASTKPSGKKYPDWRWIAFWPNCPNAGGTGWSVQKYGDERAFVSAYIARTYETVDREFVEKEYQRLLSSELYTTILSYKLASPEPSDA